MRLVIAGGGTGGHVFPGIAIAWEFLRRDSKNKVLFIGTKRGIERKAIPREGFPIRFILAGGIKNLYWVKKMISLLKLPVSIIQSICYLISFRPDFVIGVGGYASGAVGVSSFLLKIPLCIQEQNLLPGVTNSILGRLAKVIFTSFKDTAFSPCNSNIRFTGNPVRREIAVLHKRKKSKEGDRFTILIFGGSQGAATINRTVVSALDILEPVRERIRLIHQTGEKDFIKIQTAYQGRGFRVELFPFIEDMASAYQRADLVVSRSGATSLAEITAAGKAVIFIPFPHSVNNHQEYNARELEKKGGAKVILESMLSGKKLAEDILMFLREKGKTMVMSESSRRFGRPNAAEEIVNICYELVNKNV